MNRAAPRASAKMAAPVRGLEPRYYLDPEIYESERQRIFFRTWQYACHISEVEKPGDYVTFAIADQGLFVMRGADDTLRAFYNVCQHRAHELLTGSGNCRAITCPYHAWSYQTDGRLRAAPNARKVANFDAGAICLQDVRLEVFRGFVFVNLDPAADDMATWYPGAADDMERFVPGLENFQSVTAFSVEEDCNWKVAVENYNECYHCRKVHPSFTKGVIDASSVNIVPKGHTLRHSARGVDSQAASYDFGAAGGAYHVIYLWPAMSIQVYPGRVVNTYWWRTRDVAKTCVHRGWFAPRGEDTKETLEIAEIDRRTTFAEDLPILKSVQRGLASRGYRPGPLIIDPAGGVENELSVLTIHQWVRAALEA